jgi:CO dehydrogenase/acetyl-CoA synthase epsilon subunit
MKKNFIFTTLVISSLASCSNLESNQTKMQRYSPKETEKNQVPEISLKEFTFSKVNKTSGRNPASAQTTPQEVGPTQASEDSTLSNKRLYFLSLYSQYENMKIFAEKFDAPKVKICPNFHSSLLEHYDRKTAPMTSAHSPVVSKKFKYDIDKLSQADYVASRPELMLPIVKDEQHPKVLDFINNEGEKINQEKINELVHQAIDIHLAKTYSEIRELCENGVSDNYYIYENLITYIKANEFSAGTKNLNTLLKTTVFSNMAIMTSLHENKDVSKGRSIASVENNTKANQNNYSVELMNRLNINWATEYFETLKK